MTKVTAAGSIFGGAARTATGFDGVPLTNLLASLFAEMESKCFVIFKLKEPVQVRWFPQRILPSRGFVSRRLR